ncbi:MAG TPA: DegT/DnrJ/EryC1/StrS family aminotransferase [Chloroflexota bacterium]|nr:DegT/DnrJ/EryC1/StrS family aminotransferase [Chloroflexota bacterium]
MAEIRIPVFTADRQLASIRGEIDSAVERVLASGWFILGEEVRGFEEKFAEYCEAGQAVGVGNGTDAIELALRAVGTGPGDEVITVAHTAPFTGLAILATGATPVFVDVDAETMLMDASLVEAALSPATQAILPVHLSGQAADVAAIGAVARKAEIAVVVDAAQAHGASVAGSRAAALGDVAAFSFYPTKNLGAYGDGGAVVTDDPEIAERVRQLRRGGMAAEYRSELPGRNSRLDEMQAAVLRVKLPLLEGWNERRREIAARYGAKLRTVRVPDGDAGHARHLYAVRSPHRDELAAHLAERGIGSRAHYPWALHQQAAFAERCRVSGSLAQTERCCREVLSLPLFPELTDDEVAAVIAATNEFSPG